MKHTIFPKLLLISAVGLLMAATMAGCAGSQPQPVEGTEREQVLAQSEPIADSLFKGMLEQDYTAFASSFDPTMQKAMDENAFQKMMATIDPVIGKYKSRQVAKVEKVGKFIAVTYTARYELEEAVSWRLVFTPGDAMQVSGLWYDLPKLRAK